MGVGILNPIAITALNKNEERLNDWKPPDFFFFFFYSSNAFCYSSSLMS